MRENKHRCYKAESDMRPTRKTHTVSETPLQKEVKARHQFKNLTMKTDRKTLRLGMDGYERAFVRFS